MEKRISIIVPIYNVGSYLEQCIESILGQTYPYIDVILVDDGSTDNSGKVCDNYAQCNDNIRVIHKENGGLIRARYTGLCSASTEYVLFVDGDDWIIRDTCLQFMEVANRYSPDIVISGWTEYWSDNHYRLHMDIGYEEGFYNREDIRNKILGTMLWDEKINKPGIGSAVWGKLLKREQMIAQYERLKNQSFFYGEDTAVIYPYILNSNNAYIAHRADYFYRQKTETEHVKTFSGDNFFRDICTLYYYLRDQFKDVHVLLKQLDFYYMSIANRRRRSYFNKEYFAAYLFPFDQVRKGASIAIYGAGKVGKHFYGQLEQTGYCILELWVDMNVRQYHEVKVYPIESILEHEVDYIIIANSSLEMSQKIKENLIVMGVDKQKIIMGCREPLMLEG